MLHTMWFKMIIGLPGIIGNMTGNRNSTIVVSKLCVFNTNNTWINTCTYHH